MKYLLDVNVLIAAIWSTHEHHAKTTGWLSEKSIFLCPITELGFLRISSHKKALALPMKDVRSALAKFISERRPGSVSADLPALKCSAENSDEVTDLYLAELASAHGLKLVTLDSKITHSGVEKIV